MGPRTEKLEFSLRRATVEDLSQVLEIERKVHVSPWSEQHFREELEKPFSHFMVLTDDESDQLVSAYLVFWLMFEECQILNIAVDLPFRGLGLAQQMLHALVRFSVQNEVKKVSLDVRKTNEAAIQLYQKVGFTIAQVRKAFYSNGEDAYHMVLSLDEDPLQF